MIAGTVFHAVKTIGLTAGWEQKKQDIGKKQQEITPEEKQIEQFKEQLRDIREDNEYEKISNKIKTGSKLAPEEIDYLRRENPQALQDYEEIQKEKESYSRQLKGCKTKEDVWRLKQQKMGEYMTAARRLDTSPYLSEEQKSEAFAKPLAKLKAVEKEHDEFTGSPVHQSLPEEDAMPFNEIEQGELPDAPDAGPQDVTGIIENKMRKYSGMSKKVNILA